MRSVEKNAIEKQMLRLLQGEMIGDEARQLRQQIAGEASLRERYRELENVWQSLELPEAQVPIGWPQRMVATVESRVASEIRWSQAPAWVRAGVAAALLFGFGLGAGLQSAAPTEVMPWPAEEMESALTDPLSLAESYWLVLEEASTTVEMDGRESS